jgi:antitoxin component of RelBE/YafQ-DinJ toxin-antitoxin module
VPPKRTINLTVDEDLLDRFNEACRAYGHSKQKGLVLSAAIRMFLEADPREQGEYLESIFRDDIDRGVATMMEKRRRIEGDEAAAGESPSTPAARPKKAAKKKGRSKRAIKRPADR